MTLPTDTSGEPPYPTCSPSCPRQITHMQGDCECGGVNPPTRRENRPADLLATDPESDQS